MLGSIHVSWHGNQKARYNNLWNFILFAGEDQLRAAETVPGFSIILLQIVADGNTEHTVRMIASVMFKNFVKKQWQPNIKDSVLNETDKTQIKAFIVNLMLSINVPALQKQLSAAISIISEHDFYEKWPSLMSVCFEYSLFYIFHRTWLANLAKPTTMWSMACYILHIPYLKSIVTLSNRKIWFTNCCTCWRHLPHPCWHSSNKPWNWSCNTKKTRLLWQSCSSRWFCCSKFFTRWIGKICPNSLRITWRSTWKFSTHCWITTMFTC